MIYEFDFNNITLADLERIKEARIDGDKQVILITEF